jgi:hypothetical protein
MDHSEKGERVFPDESTLRTWEDMRCEVLHELQEGAEIPDAVLDSIAELAAELRSYRSVKRPSLLNTPTPLQPG